MVAHDGHRPTSVTSLAAASIVWLAASGLAPVLAANERIPVYRLEPAKVPDVPEGRVAMVAGRTTGAPDRFFVENLHMLVPVSVTVRAVGPDRPVRVRLTKGDWGAPLREGTTDGGGQVQFKLRTQGEFQIAVDSPYPDAEYKMVVWLGPDIVPRTPPIIVPASEFEGGMPPWVRWAAGGAGVVLLLALAFAFGKRRRSA